MFSLKYFLGGILTGIKESPAAAGWKDIEMYDFQDFTR